MIMHKFWRIAKGNATVRDAGVETVEWIVLAAVILALVVGLMIVFTAGGRQVATVICREVAN